MRFKLNTLFCVPADNPEPVPSAVVSPGSRQAPWESLLSIRTRHSLDAGSLKSQSRSLLTSLACSHFVTLTCVCVCFLVRVRG